MSKGQQTSYDNTVPQKRVVSDRIIMTEPYEIPLITALGLNNEGKFSFINTPGKKYEWLYDTYSSLSDPAACTGMTNSTTTTTVTVTDGTKFQIGDVIQIDSEYMWVSAISTNDLTVTRTYGGTNATHASDATVYIRSRARLEGASAGDSHFTAVTSDYNFSFIMQKTIEVSRSDARITRYGIPNIVEYEINKKMDELKMALTKKPYYGQRKEGTSSTPRDAGGLDTFITTNATALSNTPALTQKNIEDHVQKCWDNGGNPRLLICGAWAKRKITSFYEGFVRTAQSDRLGGMVIDQLQTVLGPKLDIMLDRYCPTNKIYILDPDLVGYITIDDFFYEELAKTKDTAAYGQIVGEYGFVVADEKKHAIISGFSTSS